MYNDQKLCKYLCINVTLLEKAKLESVESVRLQLGDINFVVPFLCFLSVYKLVIENKFEFFVIYILLLAIMYKSKFENSIYGEFFSSFHTIINEKKHW